MAKSSFWKAAGLLKALVPLAIALVFTGCDDVLGEIQKGLKEAETPAYSIVLSEEAYAFKSADTELALLVVNSGDEATGTLKAELTGEGREAFTLSKTELPSIAAGKSGKLVVKVVAELEAGVYKAAVVLSGDAGVAASLDVSYEVEEAEEVEDTEEEAVAEEPEAVEETDTEEEAVAEEPVEPSYGIDLSETGTYAFSLAIDGYSEQTPKLVTISNTGNQPTGALTVTLSGGDASAFALAPASIDNIEAGGTATFAVAPKTALSPATYAATVTVTGANGISESFHVSFEVRSVPAVPVEPEAVEETDTEEAEYYTVNLIIRRCGMEVQPEPQIIARGGKVVCPAVVPTVEGYVFDGWYTFIGTRMIRYNFDSPVFSNLFISTGWTDIKTGKSDRGVIDENLSYGITLTGQDGLPLRTYTLSGAASNAYLLVVVQNTSSLSKTGELTATLSGENPDAFLFGGNKNILLIPSVGWGSLLSEKFIVYPVQGLDAGTYTATVTVSGEKVLPQSFDISYTVTAFQAR